jgi:salicylate hydroxylase
MKISSIHPPLQIGILGAGPAGLMTAMALEAYLPPGRARVTLLDRNKSETDYPGVEYGIQARACRALERIGLLEQALVRGNPGTELAFYNARLGKRFRSVEYDPKYTRSVVRQEFLADLAGLLQDSSVKRRHLVTGITTAPDRAVTVSGTVEDVPFTETYDLVVACDGVNSITRKQLFPTEAVIHDRGFSCIYMLVEGTDSTAPAGFMAKANSGRSELVMGHFSTMTLFPLGHGRLALGIGFDHAARAMIWRSHGLAPDEDWKDLPAATKKSIAVTLTTDTDINDGMLVRALDLVPDWDSYKIYLWAMRDTDPLGTPWSAAGNVVLIGDAAHAIMPTIGMGASLAIEDAEALAALIANAASTAATPADFRSAMKEAVFIPFAAARHPVWVDLIDRARRAAIGNFINVGQRKRFAIGPQIPNTTLSHVVSGLEWFAEKLGV